MKFFRHLVTCLVIALVSTSLPSSQALASAADSAFASTIAKTSQTDGHSATQSEDDQIALTLKTLSTIRSSAEFKKASQEFRGIAFTPEKSLTKFGKTKAWVAFSGSRTQESVLLRVAVDTKAQRVLLIQKVRTVVGAAPDAVSMTISFNDAAPIWSGKVIGNKSVVADKGSQTLQSIQSEQGQMKAAGWCHNTVGDICGLAGGVEGAFLCYLLTSTGLTGLACGVILLIITHYGCKKLVSDICD